MNPTAFAEKYGVRLIHSLEAVEAQADACLVSTRNTEMPRVLARLLGAGKPVYAAKPVAITRDGMAAIVKARKASGLVCAAGQTARSSFALRTAVRLIAEGRIGDVLSVRAAHQHGRIADWPKDWWYKDPSEGNAFDWLGWYALDGVLALTGRRVARIAGAARRHLSPYEGMPDLIRGLATLDDGRIATLDIHFTVGPWKISFAEIEVVGTTGVLRSIGPAEEVVVLKDGGPERVPLDGGPQPLDFELSSWLGAVGGAGAPVLPLDAAADIVAAAIAWKRAAREGKWVEVEPIG
jgi:1,5-anhydro-D-fructose reductase (1,5-anhydro-D-mannitol-forming)